MKLLSKELVHFDGTAYCKKIEDENYSWEKLARNIYTKRRCVTSSIYSVVGTVLGATVTAGVSLVGTAYAGRNISVEKQKLALLEKEWERRGQPPLPKRKAQDNIIPIVIASPTTVCSFTIDISNKAGKGGGKVKRQESVSESVGEKPVENLPTAKTIDIANEPVVDEEKKEQEAKVLESAGDGTGDSPNDDVARQLLLMLILASQGKQVQQASLSETAGEDSGGSPTAVTIDVGDNRGVEDEKQMQHTSVESVRDLSTTATIEVPHNRGAEDEKMKPTEVGDDIGDLATDATITEVADNPEADLDEMQKQPSNTQEGVKAVCEESSKAADAAAASAQNGAKRGGRFGLNRLGKSFNAGATKLKSYNSQTLTSSIKSISNGIQRANTNVDIAENLLNAATDIDVADIKQAGEGKLESAIESVREEAVDASKIGSYYSKLGKGLNAGAAKLKSYNSQTLTDGIKSLSNGIQRTNTNIIAAENLLNTAADINIANIQQAEGELATVLESLKEGSVADVSNVAAIIAADVTQHGPDNGSLGGYKIGAFYNKLEKKMTNGVNALNNNAGTLNNGLQLLNTIACIVGMS